MSFASLATYNAMSLVFSEDLEPLQILDLQGVDVLGRQVVRIVGKHLPGTPYILNPCTLATTNSLKL